MADTGKTLEKLSYLGNCFRHFVPPSVSKYQSTKSLEFYERDTPNASVSAASDQDGFA